MGDRWEEKEREGERLPTPWTGEPVWPEREREGERVRGEERKRVRQRERKTKMKIVIKEGKKTYK